MSNIMHDDMVRHREWLDKELDRFPITKLPEFETVSPTYVIRVSRDRTFRALALDVANALDDLGQGADLSAGIGIWEGNRDDSVTLTVQATDEVLADVLARLATITDIRWAHVERHDVPTSYVDLHEHR